MQLVRFVTSLAATRGDLMGAVPFAEAKGWSSTAGVLKALVAPLGQGDVASALWPITVDLSEVLRPLTVIGRLQGMRRVPFATRVLTQTAGGVGTWVSEGRPIAVKADGFAVGSAMFATKCAGINVVTAEFLMNAAPASYPIIANDLVAGVAEALDHSLLDPGNAGDAATPAAITHGATSFESSGSTLAQVDSDLGKLVDSLTSNNFSLATASWIMSPKTAAFLGRLRGSGGAAAFPLINARGGSLMGLPVLTSGNVVSEGSPGEGLICLAEANEILLADDGAGDVELSNEAALQLSDAPSTGAQAQVSLWQMGLVGVKCTRIVNWAVRRPAAVATLRSVVY